MRIWGLLFTAVYIASTSPLTADDTSCPTPMLGSLRSGKYTFEFQSWSWSKDATYLFGNCVRNTSKDLSLFIDWAGLRGFVPPSDTGYFYSPHSSNGQKKVQVPLWYGAAPQKIDVETVFPDDKEPQKTKIQVPWLRTIADIPDASGSGSSTLISEGKISIPMVYRTDANLAKIITDSEEHPEILSTVKMRFVSQIDIDSTTGNIIKIFDSCKYDFSFPPGFPFGNLISVSLRFQELELQRIVFHVPHRQIGIWVGPSSFEGVRENLNVLPSALKRKSTTMVMEISPRFTGDYVLLGSIPVTYFALE